MNQQKLESVVAEKRSTFGFIAARLDSSSAPDEDRAGELWLRCGWEWVCTGFFLVHVHDLVDVEMEFEDDDELLRVAAVNGVLVGQQTQDVEWRKSVGSDLEMAKLNEKS